VLGQGFYLPHKGKRANIYRCLPLIPMPKINNYVSILGLWNSKRGDRLMPSRTDFTFEDFIGWHGSIAISVVEGQDLRFKLYGTRYVDLLGVDLTNALLCASMDESLIDQTKEYFSELINGPYLGHMSGLAPTKGRDFTKFDVVDLPLSDNGTGVTQFLHALSSE
jgi:hypothetical protein